MMFGYGNHWDFWQFALMGIAMVAFWGFVVWAVVALARNNKPTHHHHDDDARQILDRRLANGDLDAEDYRRLVDALKHDSRLGNSVGIDG
jgi:putative membrane protein